MKKIAIILLFSCAFTKVRAQLNFVLNGSFEQHSACPNQFDQIKYADFWNSIDTSWSPGDTIMGSQPGCLPEYINKCGSGVSDIPFNGIFYQYPRTGAAMAMSELYYNYGISWLDQYNYLQGRLKSHLIAGKSYCVTFYVNMANGSAYAVNKIGAYLDDGSIDTTSRCAVPQTQYTPQVLDTNIIRDTLNWVKIQGNFTANGTEKFITLGDFFDTGNIRKIEIYTGGYTGVYLFDDVSVIASDAVAYAGLDTAIRPGDTAHIGAPENGDGMPCWWYVLGGSSPIDSGGTISVHPATNTTYVVKMDLCGTVTYDTVQVRVWPAGVAPTFASLSGVTCYPNPATNEVTIEGAKDCEVVFYDVVGRKAALFAAITNKEVIDISTLQRGLYLVGITDKITGERVTRLLRVAQ